MAGWSAAVSMEQLITPNAEHVKVWNEILVPKFRRFRQVLVGGFSGHSDAAFAKFPPQPGQRVLDVGCGFGETSLQLASMVGPAGYVLGVDCCDAFIETGRDDARHTGLHNLHFAVADAQVARFDTDFDLCFSRFGTMFFGSPVAALRNLRRALKPQGRLMMIVWRDIGDNPWLGLPKGIAQAHLPAPPDDAPNCGPGPFSMADQATVTQMLTAAGFEAPSFMRTDVRSCIGATPQAAVEFQLLLGPAGEIVREAGEAGERKRAIIEAEVLALLAKHTTEQGVVLGSSAWCVTARNPG